MFPKIASMPIITNARRTVPIFGLSLIMFVYFSKLCLASSPKLYSSFLRTIIISLTAFYEGSKIYDSFCDLFLSILF